MPTKYYLHPVGPQQVQIVFILGDIHGLWNQLNAVINTNIRQNSRLRRFAESTKVEVVVLQCGDFGYWPHTGQAADAVSNIKNAVPFLHDGHVKLFWCDGNHENHDALDALERRYPGQPFIEVAPHIHFATFGSVLKLAAGTVLFAGGAVSSDKEGRTPGESWWAQETIDDADMARLPEATTRVDIVVSHTSPRIFPTPRWTDYAKIHDPSRTYLDTVLSRYRPKRWFYGHYHEYTFGNCEGCQWTGLGAMGLGSERWCVNVGALESFSAFGTPEQKCHE